MKHIILISILALVSCRLGEELDFEIKKDILECGRVVKAVCLSSHSHSGFGVECRAAIVVQHCLDPVCVTQNKRITIFRIVMEDDLVCLEQERIIHKNKNLETQYSAGWKILE